MPVLANPLNSDLLKGFAVAQVAMLTSYNYNEEVADEITKDIFNIYYHREDEAP